MPADSKVNSCLISSGAGSSKNERELWKRQVVRTELESQKSAGNYPHTLNLDASELASVHAGSEWLPAIV